MPEYKDSDISLKEFILKVQDYIAELLRSWKFITFMGFLMAFLYFALKFNTKPLYSAELTFMLNEDESGSLGGLASLMGQFGLPGASSESNLDKILQLSKARTIAQKTLFEKMVLDGKEDYLANHLIESFDNIGKWKSGRLAKLLGGADDDLNIDDFRFTHDSIEAFTLKENKALKQIHFLFAGNEKRVGYFTSEYNDLTSIMKFRAMTSDPELSINLVNTQFEKLSKYYTEKTIEKQQYDYKIIKTKYDSIRTELNRVQNELAYFQDSRRDLFRKQDQLIENKLKIEEQKLFTIYAEAEKQKQIAELTLNNQTPYIQDIDKPIGPLRPVNAGRFFYFLLGGFLGGLLACAIVVVRKIYRDIMNS